MFGSSSASEGRSLLHLTANADGGVLLDMEHDRFLKLNRIGVEVWELLVAGATEANIVTRIAEQYRTDPARVTADVHALLQKIADMKLDAQVRMAIGPPPQSAQSAEVTWLPWYGDASRARPQTQPTTVVFAWIGLALFDLVLSLTSLKTLCACVRRWPTRRRHPSDPQRVMRACSAVERACVWYPKKAVCLQRSAVTTCLLRAQGLPARMTLGVRPMPFMAHAWVEVEGAVVNDWPNVKRFYGSLTSY
jgi:hypothetical protein